MLFWNTAFPSSVWFLGSNGVGRKVTTRGAGVTGSAFALRLRPGRRNGPLFLFLGVGRTLV